MQARRAKSLTGDSLLVGVVRDLDAGVGIATA